MIARLLLILRVPPEKMPVYRDGVLGIPVVLGIIVACGPLFFFVGHQPIPRDVLWHAAVGFVLAVAVSLLSPNWNQLLAAGWIFMTLRALVALLISKAPQVLALGAVFLMLAIACLCLNRSAKGTRM